MKRFGFFLLLFFVLGIFFPRSSFSQTTDQVQRSTTIISPNQVINHDYFVADSSVVMTGTVNGDLYVAGGTVDVDGTVNGDILAAGGTVTINGKVTQNVRAVGGNIHIEGTVGRNVSVAGGTVDIASSSKINGSIAAAGGQILILSPVAKDLSLAGGQVTVDSVVNGNISAMVNHLTIGSNAKVKGDLNYAGANQAIIQSGAIISGKTSYRYVSRNQSSIPQPETIAGKILQAVAFFKIIGFVSTVIVGILILLFFPIFTKTVTETVSQKPWQSFGIGLVGAIVTPVLCIILLITVVGIPLAFLVGGLFAMFMYISKIFVASLVGEKIFSTLKIQTHIIWSLILGLMLYEVLSFIPFINFLLFFVVYTTGFGALLIAIKSCYDLLKGKKLA